MQYPTVLLSVKSRIAKRTFALFILCALIPIVLLSVLASRQVDAVYQTQLQQEMRRSAKGIGMLLFERLQYLKRQAVLFAETYPSSLENAGLPIDADQNLLFVEVNTPQSDDVSADLRTELNQPGTVLVSFTGSYPDNHVWLYHRSSDPGTNSLTAMETTSTYLWEGLDEYDAAYNFRVRDASGRLLYSDAQRSGTPDSGSTGTMPTASWNLLAVDNFHQSLDWEIEALLKDEEILGDQQNFRTVIVYTTLLAVMLAGLIGSYAIRKSTSPIAALMEGIDRIKQNDFNHQVKITSNDEYAELGQAFNTMSGKLGQHISAIQSLSAIDQLILNRLKIEDIIAVVMARGGALLQAASHYFVVQTEQSDQFALYGTSGDDVPVVALDHALQAMLRNAPTFLGEAELNRLREWGIPLDASAYVHVSVLEQAEKIRAILLVEFAHPPDEDLLSITRSFCDHVNVALANADWESRLFEQAHYDSLTGLPNRYYFNDQFHSMMKQAGELGHNLALLFIDVDNFKRINDSIGHGTGDAVLTHIAHAMNAVIDSKSRIFRIGGDEFVVIFCSEKQDRQQLIAQVSSLAERLRLAAKTPVKVSQRQIQNSISIGVALYPYDAESADLLLQRSDEAMLVAKGGGKNIVRYFSDIDNDDAINNERFLTELRRALIEDEFELYYQPKVNSDTGQLVGCEALIRWNHPVRGLLSPYFFIAQAEKAGMIADIGRWVLHKAAWQQAQWLENNIVVGRVSVNVSVLQLSQGDFLRDCQNSLFASGCPAQALEIEITESAYVEDMVSFQDVLEQLSSMGLSLAVDDYGTGYSSLSMLMNLPISCLKIDKSFIDDIEHSGVSFAIVESTIKLARKVGLEVVVEGVENQTQLRLLQDCGGNVIQGYYFSKPVTAQQFEKFSESGYFASLLPVSDYPVDSAS